MWTIISFVCCTVLVALGTYAIVRKDDRSSNVGFFLAGRNLSFPFIAGSLLLTNLSTEQIVGLNGSAFKTGLSVMAWEVVAVISLVFMAWFFLPRFLRCGVITVPEFLELRFGRRTGMIANVIFLASYMVILLPIILYTGAVGLSSMLDLDALLHLNHQQAIVAVVLGIGVVGSMYALFGGLRTVAVSDTLNGVGLLLGGFLMAGFGLAAIGGGEGLWHGFVTLKSGLPEEFNSIGGANSEVPFGTIFSGVLLINIFYWCTNQQIIQRTLGAKSLDEGQKGVLLTGFLKLIGPLYLVLPGLIALYFYKYGFNGGSFNVPLRANGLPNSDLAYGVLVRSVLPPVLTGFFAAVIVGAILSSFNSALNSTCTLFSLGIYKSWIKPAAPDREVVAAGRWFGLAIAVGAMVIAPLLGATGSIFDYLQTMNGIYFIPILAVVAVGMLSNRVPHKAAEWALAGGVLVIAIGYFVPPFNLVAKSIGNYHFLALVFLYLMLFMLVYGNVRPLEREFVIPDARAVAMQPWRWTYWVGGALLVLVVLFYMLFADFSVLKS